MDDNFDSLDDAELFLLWLPCVKKISEDIKSSPVKSTIINQYMFEDVTSFLLVMIFVTWLLKNLSTRAPISYKSVSSWLVLL